MKTIFLFFWLILFTVQLYGQEIADYVLKARAYSAAGKPDEAVKILDEAISINGRSGLYIERAEASILKGDYSSAISDYNEANKLTPSSGEYGLSRIYALKRDAITALYHLEISMNSPYKRSEKEIMLDPAFSPVENTAQWRQFWKKEWYSEEEKGISEIEYYISAGNTGESARILSELIKSRGTSDELLYADAAVNIAEGKYPEAVKILSGLIGANPANEKYLRLLARAQSASSNSAGASDTYTLLLNSGVADAELFFLRAECYRKTGETDKSLKDVEKYLELYPDNRQALSLAGKVEIMSGDNLKALEYFSRNLKLHPNDPECYVDRANSYLASKSWEWAEKDYSMALDLKPGNSDTWLNKGIALLNSGKVDDACHDFRKSMSLGNKRASEYISRECIK
jgi:tetratricopeptide (TPR) repeat protein